nr:MAG TPA: antirepressor [Caudoviricetes sp.]
MTNSIVKFENQDIELITVDGQPMMTLPQIVGALGASPNQAGNLYTRHADEFTPEMTRIIKQGRTRVRVFNREGAWLIGMFARTPKAAAFRKWVITALAEHVDGMSANGQTALPPPAETKEEKIARKITMLMMAECQIIKSDWFSELTAELEQARKTIKEQQETLQKISSFLPPAK